MQTMSMPTTTKPISRNAADGGFRHASATPVTAGEPTLAGSRDLPELLPAVGTPNGVRNAHQPRAGWEDSVAYSGAPVEQRATLSARELGEPKERLDALPLVPGGDAWADDRVLSGESMRRFFACVLGALAAVILCVATVTAASALGMQPRYPAYAGEDDFSLRVAWFILLELPGFVVLGGWLGYVAAGRVRRGVLGAAGMIAGTVIAFLVQSGLRPMIESLPNSTSANVAVVVFLVAWLVLASGGAVLGVLRAGKPAGGAKPEV